MAKRTEHDNLSKDFKEGYLRGRYDAEQEFRRRFNLDDGITDRFGDALGALERLMDGSFYHLRLTPEDAGKFLHCKLAIRTTRWPRHYIYYKAGPWPSSVDYLPGLLGKAHAFESGELRPSPDNYS